MTPSIHIETLKKLAPNQAGNKLILNSISVDFPKGRLSLIIGKNGSGKSTLVNCIAGLTDFDAGLIQVTDNNINYTLKKGLYEDIDPEIRKRVGVVFQEKALWPHLSVLENVAHPLRKILALPPADAKEKARLFLNRCGIGDKHFKKYPLQLSGGEQRKVAVARTLAMDPEMLLVDELEANLDQSAFDIIFNVIREKFLDIPQPKTVILISHRVDLFERYAPCIVLLDEGKVIETADNFDQLLAKRNNNQEVCSFFKEIIDPARTQWYFGRQCLKVSKEISKEIVKINGNVGKVNDREELICKIGEKIFSLLNDLEEDAGHLLLIVTKQKENTDSYRILSAEKKNFELNGRDSIQLGKELLTKGELQQGILKYDFVPDHRRVIINKTCIFAGSGSLIDWIFETNANGISYQSVEGAEKIPGVHHISPNEKYRGNYVQLSKSTNNVYIIAIKEDENEIKGVISIDTTSMGKWSNLVVEQLVVIANMAAIAINQLEQSINHV